MHLLSSLFEILHCLNTVIITFSLYFLIKKIHFCVISQILKFYISLSPSSRQLLRHIINWCATKRKVRCFLYYDTAVVIRYNLVFRNVRIEKQKLSSNWWNYHALINPDGCYSCCQSLPQTVSSLWRFKASGTCSLSGFLIHYDLSIHEHRGPQGL